jgi:hypothetical protein
MMNKKEKCIAVSTLRKNRKALISASRYRLGRLARRACFISIWTAATVLADFPKSIYNYYTITVVLSHVLFRLGILNPVWILAPAVEAQGASS